MQNSLKILTYNINKSRPWHFLTDSFEETRKLIIESSADIVFLQEIQGEHKKKKFTSPRYERMADSIWSDFAYAKNAITQKGNHGNAILSKFPIAKWEQENLSTNRFEQRGLLYCEVDCFNGLSLYCVHLDLLLRGRLIQIKKIIERINREPSDRPVILAGDFNDWDGTIGRLIERNTDLVEVHRSTKGHFGKTFPAYYPLLPLDRIYTKNLSVKTSEVLRLTRPTSDHLPLVSEVVFNG